jgi:hypothetical protein
VRPNETNAQDSGGSTGKPRKAGASGKQKTQLIVLVVLSLLLVGVVAMQLRGSSTEYEVAALAVGAMLAPEAEAAPELAAAEEQPRARDNPVLSAPPADEGLERNPFANFWNNQVAGKDAAQNVPPPQVALGMTMPGSTRPLAIIDGRMRFVGEAIQGWTLAEVRPRAVVLQSPAEERLVVEMLVHLPTVVVPPGHAP